MDGREQTKGQLATLHASPPFFYFLELDHPQESKQMITQQIAEQAARISGSASLATGTITAGATVAKHEGFMSWMGDNALAIGGICSVCTLVLYFIFGAIGVWFKFRK